MYCQIPKLDYDRNRRSGCCLEYKKHLVIAEQGENFTTKFIIKQQRYYHHYYLHHHHHQRNHHSHYHCIIISWQTKFLNVTNTLTMAIIITRFIKIIMIVGNILFSVSFLPILFPIFFIEKPVFLKI